MNRLSILAILLTLFVTNVFAQRPPTLTDDDIETTRSAKPKSEEKPKPNSAAPAPGTIANWGEVAPTGGGFKVAMPGRPTTNTQAQEFLLFGKIEHHVIQVGEGKSFYQVTYFRLPESEKIDTSTASFRQAFFSGLAQGLVKSLQGELLTETTITHEGSEGREMQIKTEYGIVWSRMFLMNGMVYSLSVLSASQERENQNRFFGSFTIQ